MSVIIKDFDLKGDDIVELPTEIETLKNQISDYDQKRLGESEAKFLKQIDDKKRAILIISRMKKKTDKGTKLKGLYIL